MRREELLQENRTLRAEIAEVKAQMAKYLPSNELQACKARLRELNDRIRDVEYELGQWRQERTAPGISGKVHALLLAIDAFLLSADDDEAALDALVAAREAFGEIR